jgi:2-furoyl-CoA dehydrogenase large subunit
LPDVVQQTIRETVFWTSPELTPPDDQDRINASLCYGFIFDFCGVEIDRTTLMTRIDRYVTMHDCGTILHPGMVDGQIRGGFAQALGAALYEEYAYAADGSFLTGTFADYLLPTTTEVPNPVILHMETPSPFTPLGSKGVGEGNCMSTPACIANAVADALGMKDVELPLVPAKLADIVRGAEPPPPASPRADTPRAAKGGRQLRGEGSTTVAAPPEAVWTMLLDPATLQAVIPGCHSVEKISDTHFRADVTIGIGPVEGRYRAEVTLSDLDAPRAATLGGFAEGALGYGNGEGRIALTPDKAGTVVRYEYDAVIGGKVASIGGRLLDGAARIIIGQFFAGLARQAGGASAEAGPSLLRRLSSLFGRRS